MSDHKVRQVTIKKCKLLIEREIGDKERLEQMQMKVARGLPLLVSNQAYLDGLVLKNLSEEEIQSIKKEVESAVLEKSDIVERELLHCICCGNAKKHLDQGGMCGSCYLDYNIKISKFITRPTGGATF